MTSYNTFSEKHLARSEERWFKAMQIDKLFREKLTRDEIAKQLGLSRSYVVGVINSQQILDVPDWFKKQKSV